MQKYQKYRSVAVISRPMESLRRDGCGLINCRPRRRYGQSVHNEIQAIIDVRVKGAH